VNETVRRYLLGEEKQDSWKETGNFFFCSVAKSQRGKKRVRLYFLNLLSGTVPGLTVGFLSFTSKV